MTPRLYSPEPLADGLAVALSAEQAHYLRAVLRREAGDEILLFNARDGEFGARIVELSKKNGLARIEKRIKPPQKEEPLELLFAPVKRAAVEAIVQKATELGATHICPVITRRTNAEIVRVDRLTAIAVEAAEQCKRLEPPVIRAPRKLTEALDAWPEQETLVFCDEAGDNAEFEWGGPDGRAAPFLRAIADAGPRAALIGPEGGFDPEERADLRRRSFVIPASLGPLILRADTAAILALGLIAAARLAKP
jgi:16S rRNA (uracil1498-N3)-methyltransferase